MTTHIALFRAINVGGKQLLPMKSLCALLEGLGLHGVQSYIQSGNVVFDSDRPPSELTGEIAEAVMQQHGFRPQLLLLNNAQFRAAVDNIPFTCDKALHLFFLFTKASSPDLHRLDALRSESEQYQLTDQVFYLSAPDNIGRSRLVSQLGKCLGVAVTGRNWNTVTRLREMIEGAGSVVSSGAP